MVQYIQALIVVPEALRLGKRKLLLGGGGVERMVGDIEFCHVGMNRRIKLD